LCLLCRVVSQIPLQRHNRLVATCYGLVFPFTLFHSVLSQRRFQFVSTDFQFYFLFIFLFSFYFLVFVF